MGKKKKGLKTPLETAALTPAQKAARTRAEKDRLAAARAQQLAQIVNLHIGGFSLAQIGASIGASPQEVEDLLNSETSQYIRSQPALRVYVRNFVSSKYTSLLGAVWDEAVDKQHPQKLDNQDRALRILKEMARLHGAEAPTQSEIKVESAPEAVEKMVAALAAAQGAGYDADIFDGDVVDAELVEESAAQAKTALSVSGNEVAERTEEDEW